VAWEHTVAERASFGFAEQRLLFMYTFLLPEPSLWFVVAENASVGTGHAWGQVVVPLDNKVEFDLFVVNQTAKIEISKRGRIAFHADNGQVAQFSLHDMPKTVVPCGSTAVCMTCGGAYEATPIGGAVVRETGAVEARQSFDSVAAIYERIRPCYPPRRPRRR